MAIVFMFNKDAVNSVKDLVRIRFSLSLWMIRHSIYAKRVEGVGKGG
jgi:hypothetical protein